MITIFVLIMLNFILIESNKMTKTWFITGGSKGLGLELTRQLLSQNQQVAVTTRDVDSIQEKFGDNRHLLILNVNLKDEKSITDAITQTVKTFGKIDVIINNAGYAQQGAVEALSDAEIRSNFDINVFAPINVIRHALPYLRQQRNGRIINIASIVGFNGGYAGWGSYVSSKFAIAGITETLAVELAEVGIKASVVYPGPVRTEFLSQASLKIASNTVADYQEAQASLDLHLNELAGKQIGDPVKVASFIIDIANMPNPPVHVFAGSIAVDLAKSKLESVKQDVAKVEKLSVATDFKA